MEGAQRRVSLTPPPPEPSSGLASTIFGGLASLLGGVTGFAVTGGNPLGAAAGASLLGGLVGGGQKHAEEKGAVEELNVWKRKYAPNQPQTPEPGSPVPGLVTSGLTNLATSAVMSGLTAPTSPPAGTTGTQAGFLEAQLPEGTSFSEQIALAKRFSDQLPVDPSVAVTGQPKSRLSDVNLAGIFEQGKGFYEMPATAAQAAAGTPSTVAITEGPYRGGSGPATGGFAPAAVAAPPSLEETWIEDPGLAWQIAARTELANQAAQAAAAKELARAQINERLGMEQGFPAVRRGRESLEFAPVPATERILPTPRLQRSAEAGLTALGTPLGLERRSIEQMIEDAPRVGQTDVPAQTRPRESVMLMDQMERSGVTEHQASYEEAFPAAQKLYAGEDYAGAARLMEDVASGSGSLEDRVQASRMAGMAQVMSNKPAAAIQHLEFALRPENMVFLTPSQQSGLRAMLTRAIGAANL